MQTRASPANEHGSALHGRTWAGRLGAAMFVVSGAIVLALVVLIPDSEAAGLEPVFGIGAILFGAATFFAPWQRWSERALLVFPILGLVLLGFGVALGGGTLDYFAAVFPIPFLYAGLTQRPGTVVALTPVALGPILTAAILGEWSAAAATNLAIALPMAVVIGELLAVANRRQQRSEESVARLLEGVRELNRAGDEDAVAEVIAALGVALGEADTCVVVLVGSPGGDRHVLRAVRGHPSTVGRVRLDPAVAEEVMSASVRAGKPALLPDLDDRTSWPGRTVADLDMRSVFLVPLAASTGALGAVAVMWRGRRTRVAAGMRAQLELLAEEGERAIERVRATAQLTHEAGTDALTSLANRRTYARALDRIEPGDAVVIVDLDRFKEINDREGHDAGDAVLRTMAECLRGVARAGDCVARYGGEEFALVLAHAGIDGARAAMARAKQAWEERSGPTTFSGGIAVARPGESPAETLRRADVALYAAKTGGRDRVELAPAAAAS